MTTRHRALLIALLSVATGLMVILAWRDLWSMGAAVGFGTDLDAYRAAAQRLAATGNPYHPALLDGPVANVSENIPVAYLYAPPLAQLFLLLVGVQPIPLALAWALLQTAIVIVLLPLVYRRFGGRLTTEAVLAIWLIGGLSYPLENALIIGNVSGWIVIGVCLMLLLRPRGAGIAAAALAVVKTTSVLLLIPALVAPRSRKSALLAVLALVTASFVMAPGAWLDWLRVMPNILRFPPSPYPRNYAPVAVLGAFGAPLLGMLIGYAATAAAAVASVVLSYRGRWAGAVAAASVALVFSAGTIWDHYIAVLVPLVVAAWPRASSSARAVFSVFYLSHIAGWVLVMPPDPVRLVYLIVLVVTAATLVLSLSGASIGQDTRNRSDHHDGPTALRRLVDKVHARHAAQHASG